MSGSIGPSLPPGFMVRSSSEEESSGEEDGERQESKNTDSENTPSTVESHTYGPALPPALLPGRQDPDSSLGATSIPSESEDSSTGDEDEVIGPMPIAMGTKVGGAEDVERRKLEIESRAQAMKDRLTGKNEVSAPKREEWMTELPVEFKPLGIVARKFRTKVPEGGDRSGWTDTPADKIRKAEEARTGKKEGSKKEPDKVKEKRKEDTLEDTLEYAYVKKRDKKMKHQVEEHNKEHRAVSLIDMHRRKRKEAQRGGGDSSERTPFNRETDLEAPRNMVAPAKRVALMSDSKLALNSKFQHGSRSFL